MSDLLTRTSHADLEVRGGDGRTVVGIAMPFDEPANIVEPSGQRFVETFRRGAFARTIRERGDRVKFLAQHNRQAMPLGRATLLREDTQGLYGEFRVSKTTAGDEVLELVRDGALDGLSVGFAPLSNGDRWNATRSEVERLEVALREVSAVTFPAFAGAGIAGVRSAVPVLTIPQARLRLLALKEPPR